MLNEREYFAPWAQARFSVPEREKLWRLRGAYQRGEMREDTLDRNRLAFARYLFLTGRIGEGLSAEEDAHGAGTQGRGRAPAGWE